MFRGSFNFVTTLLAAAAAVAAVVCFRETNSPGWTALVLSAGLYVSLSPRIIQEWERGVQLRLGRFRRCLQPGIAWLVPGADSLAAVVDMRVRSTSFSAEKTLTRDTVPVNVDAVLFWVVTDAQRAILEVEWFEQTISWAAQTTLRDVIGKTELVRMISDREKLDEELRTIIDAKTSEWGITVQSVEVRDVKLPAGLEDAMSRKAQADREKEARVVLAESELKVAEQMELASVLYHRNPAAFQLRAMNMTYEAVKERGALMVIPSGMVEATHSSALFGMAASGFRVSEGEE
ncbi:MAG: slipin family protein [Planctomycetales bacterium]|nr:slipin family protein [Planctomycetales bacterium]